ncbi:MAG TPA: acyl carrier protein [Acidisarcina sp.]
MSVAEAIRTEDKIRSYIFDEYPFLAAKGLHDEDPLLGVLDSLAVLGLIGFIEPEFSLHLDTSDITDENFATIASIKQLVQRLSPPSRTPGTSTQQYQLGT